MMRPIPPTVGLRRSDPVNYSATWAQRMTMAASEALFRTTSWLGCQQRSAGSELLGALSSGGSGRFVIVRRSDKQTWIIERPTVSTLRNTNNDHV